MSNGLEVFTGGAFPERVKAQDIALPEDTALMEARPNLSLLGDVRVSTYGAIGFALLDSAPENRIISWNHESESYGLEGYDADSDVEAGYVPADFASDSRFYGTRHGFKIIRYAILPPALLETLDTNKWVGPAVLRQALEEDVVPAEYYEEAVHPANAVLVHDKYKRGKELEEATHMYEGKLLYLKSILRSLEGDTITDADFEKAEPYVRQGPRLPEHHRTYVSYHPWVFFGEVQQGYTEGVARMLANIDELMAQFVDRDGLVQGEVQARLADDPRYLPVARVALEGHALGSGDE